MTIQYASDLHLNVKENADFISTGAIRPCGEIMMMAGDICSLDQWDSTHDGFFDWLSDNYRQVLIVPGIKEFSQPSSMSLLGKSWRMMLRENVGVYHNQRVRIDDKTLLLGDTISETEETLFDIAMTHPLPSKEMLKAHHARYWIHGQTHENAIGNHRWQKPQRKRQGTILLTNQLGYVPYNQHLQGYQINQCIEV